MKVNTMIVAVVAAASGGIGFGVARLSESPRSERAAAPSRHETDVHRVRADLAIARAETDGLRERLERELGRRPQSAAPTEHKVAPTVEERVQRVARELRVPPAVLEIAIRAERMVRQKRTGADKAVQELADHGETGFRAVVAMLRGGQFGDAFDPLVKATYRPGVQGLLLETISLPDVPKPSELSAIDAMIHADTPDVRDALVTRLQSEQDPETFWHIARALSSLGEPRGALPCEDKLLPSERYDETVWGFWRLPILAQLGEMGGEQAKRILLAYVADERVTRWEDLGVGLAQLQVFGRELAEKNALAIYQSARAATLDEKALSVLRGYAGIEED